MSNEIWWWNDAVNTAIKEKRHAWKRWEQRGSKEEYKKPKRLQGLLSTMLSNKPRQNIFQTLI